MYISARGRHTPEVYIREGIKKSYGPVCKRGGGVNPQSATKIGLCRKKVGVVLTNIQNI